MTSFFKSTDIKSEENTGVASASTLNSNNPSSFFHPTSHNNIEAAYYKLSKLEWATVRHCIFQKNAGIFDGSIETTSDKTDNKISSSIKKWVESFANYRVFNNPVLFAYLVVAKTEPVNRDPNYHTFANELISNIEMLRKYAREKGLPAADNQTINTFLKDLGYPDAQYDDISTLVLSGSNEPFVPSL